MTCRVGGWLMVLLTVQVALTGAWAMEALSERGLAAAAMPGSEERRGGMLAAASQGQTELVVAEEYLPNTLNPLSYNNMVERRTIELVHDALFKPGNDSELKPSLIDVRDGKAIFEVAPDRMSVTGTLKSATFHNGSAITVEDLRATLKAYSAASGDTLSTRFYRGLFSGVEGVVPNVRQNFRIIFAQRLPVPREALVPKLLPRSAFSWPDDPASWARDTRYKQTPVGAGPFRVLPKQAGNLNLELEAFEKYHRGRPRIDRIVITAIPGVADRINSLLMDQVQVLVTVPKAAQSQIKDAHNAYTIPYFIRNWWYLGFNCKLEPFSDVRVRDALALAIDRHELARELANEVAEASTANLNIMPTDQTQSGRDPSVMLVSGPFVPESTYYDFNIPQPRHSLADARKALGAIPGFTWDKTNRLWLFKGRPFTLRLVARADMPNAEDVVNVLRDQLAEFGVKVRVKMLGEAEWATDVDPLSPTSGRFDLVLGRFHFDISDDIAPIFQTGGRLNVFKYSNPQIDQQLQQAELEPDFDLRVGRMKQLHAALAQQKPCLFLWEANQVAAFSTRVRNHKIHSFSFYINPHNWEVAKP